MGLFNKATNDQPKAPKYLDNINERLVDDLKQTIQKGSKVSIAAASFSIYAFEALKKELNNVDEFRFLFTGEAFTKERAPKEAREFYIPRLNRERSLYGSDFEVRLRNELNQQAIAKECADWIKKKAKFKSNISHEFMSPFMTVEDGGEKVAYNPMNQFTTAELGLDRGNNAYSTTMKLYAPNAQQFFEMFNQIWDDSERLTDVTDTVLDNITAAYKENSPEFIYFVALYNIFNEFLEDINEDTLPNEATGFKNSKIWEMLYNFQRDAVVGCISKLEKHGGCILADSVGLGKTFSALGVIKYYECRNKSVLVLCPKRLQTNWNTFKHNYKNNPIAVDRLNYDVLYHTDLDRERGKSSDMDLSMINWGNYDLVVIDESHNFRNGESHIGRKAEEGYENRYQKLMRKIIKSGVKTKVLMLSATPVNIDFTDLKNQLMIACEGDAENLNRTLKTNSSLDKIFKDANNAFREWAEQEPELRTTESLLEKLNFDFFDLLDSVTIARSRKHVEKYYNEENLGTFPERRKPISHRPDLTDIDGITFDMIFEHIDGLNLDIYTPLKYVHPSKLAKYVNVESASGKSWENREAGRNVLMITNLLKRIESSIYAFRMTVERLYDLIDHTIDNIDRFEQGRADNFDMEEIIDQVNDLEEDDIDSEYSVGKDLKIKLEDMDWMSWREKLRADKEVLNDLLTKINLVTSEHDLKLKELETVIEDKINAPINPDNKKLIIFTAFSDTADYLYGELKEKIFEKYGLHTAVITGGKNPETTLDGVAKDFNEILTYFSPKSKNRDALDRKNIGDIDILIATDCISEGQNLQDCDYLVNYDIHWNPVRIIQRFGRIDRIGSDNKTIQLVNFWPNITLDSYINLKARVENRTKLVSITSAGEDVLENMDPDLEYRKKQLEKLQNEMVDLEEINGGVNIMDLGLNEFHLDVKELKDKYGDADYVPFGISAIAAALPDAPAGVIYILKNINSNVNIDKQNRLHPFYLVYITESGEIFVNHLNPKVLLDKMRLLCKGKDKPEKALVEVFNTETNNGKNMDKYSELLSSAIHSIIEVKDGKDLDSLFKAGGTTALTNQISGLDDFELINFLVVK